jgi:hypothetical protein
LSPSSHPYEFERIQKSIKDNSTSRLQKRLKQFSFVAGQILLYKSLSKDQIAYATDNLVQGGMIESMPKVPFVDGSKKFINGELQTFYGEKRDVTSPILDPTSGKPFVIGKLAQMTEKDAIQAIESADRAWKSGKWSKITSQERILKMKNVIKNLGAKREQIADILMWEICKTRQDALTEFGLIF